MASERQKEWLLLAGLCGLALGLRLVFFFQTRGEPYFETLFLDALAYDTRARAILGGDWLGTKVFYQDPLYPYFLALVYKLLGPDPGLARLVQLVLGTLGAALVYLLGRSLGGRRAGVLAGLLFVGYPLFCYYDGLLGKDGPGLLLVNLALVALFWAARRPGPWAWLGAGLAFGLAALSRGNLLLVAPLLAGWIVLAPEKAFPARLARAGLFVLGLALIISPVTLRNWVVGRDLVLTTAQAGQNFYIGNNPAASGFFENPERIRLNPQFEEEDFRQEALRRTGRSEMKPSEVSSFWMKQGLKFAWTHPSRFLELLGIKTAMFFNDFEIPDNYNFYFAQNQAPLLKLLPLSFGLAAPLGLVGLVLLWPERRRFFLPALFFCGYLLSIVPFHMASRYRLPVAPLLLCTGAVLLGWLFDRARERQWWPVLKALVPVVLLGVFCFWPFYPEEQTFDAPYTALGIAAAQAGEHEKAVGYFQEALKVNPEYAPARYNLGTAYLALKEYVRAEAELRRVTEIDPHFVMAWINLGNLHLLRGRPWKAQEVFHQALGYNPRAAEAYLGLGQSLHARGLFGPARTAFQQALQIKPDLAPAHYNLACALARMGLAEQAWSHLKRAVRLDPRLLDLAPDDPDLRPLGPPSEIQRRLGG